ncbi:MAG TPA: hypothetical protein VG870_03700 [Chitinophagaceae bacterium]|nr:hypothetical protein [Chitinophagaceae bacterium]
MTRTIFLLVLFLTIGSSYAQPLHKPVSAIIHCLLSKDRSIPVISHLHFDHFIPASLLSRGLEDQPQYLLRGRSGLYAGVNGTGILFRVSDSAGSLVFDREDSTVYQGHDFYAANFALNDTLFSFGGYGFWRSNGLLRYFDWGAREWDLLPTDKEIPFYKGTFWLDPQARELYIIGSQFINDGISTTQSDLPNETAVVRKLNLPAGRWSELGKINLPKDDFIFLNSPWGCLIINFKTYSIGLLDFTDNQALHLQKRPYERLAQVIKSYGAGPDVYFFSDSTLYFGNTKGNAVDSIQISKNDFHYDKPLMNKGEGRSPVDLFGWLLIILAFLAAMGLLLKKRKTKKNLVYDDGSSRNSAETDTHTLRSIKFTGQRVSQSESVYNEFEKQLIRYLLKKGKDEIPVTVEEFNRQLGLAGKHESIQKKNRNDILNTINQKWQLGYGENGPLILRKRSDFDKRSFEYYLNPAYFESCEKLLE